MNEQLRNNETERVSDIRVRQVQWEDMSTLVEWFNHPSVAEHFASSPKSSEELWNYYSQEDQHGLVAVDSQGDLVGVLTLRDNMASGKRNGYMERVAVNPEKHNKGIGTRMLKEALVWAFSPEGAAYYKITLGVVVGVDSWERTRHVYEKLGFREVGVWRNHVVVSVDTKSLTDNDCIERKVGNNTEIVEVKDAIWMDLLSSEWQERNSHE